MTNEMKKPQADFSKIVFFPFFETSLEISVNPVTLSVKPRRVLKSEG